MEEQEIQEIKAMLFAVYKKLLEIEDAQKGSGNGGTHPAWSVIKELKKETEKIKAELRNSG